MSNDKRSYVSPVPSTRGRAARFSRAIMKSDRYCWALLSTLLRGNDHVERDNDCVISLHDTLPFIKYGFPLSLCRHRCLSRNSTIHLSFVSCWSSSK